MSSAWTEQGKKILLAALGEDMNPRNPFIKEGGGNVYARFDSFGVTFHTDFYGAEYVRFTFRWKDEDVWFVESYIPITFNTGDSINIIGIEGRAEVTAEI